MPPISPCGHAVDWGRYPRREEWRFFDDTEETSTVVWFPVPDSTPFLPFSHPWLSQQLESDPGHSWAFGPVDPVAPYQADAVPPFAFSLQTWCGTPAQWRGDGMTVPVPPIPMHPAPADMVPLCCTASPPPEPPPPPPPTQPLAWWSGGTVAGMGVDSPLATWFSARIDGPILRREQGAVLAYVTDLFGPWGGAFPLDSIMTLAASLALGNRHKIYMAYVPVRPAAPAGWVDTVLNEPTAGGAIYAEGGAGWTYEDSHNTAFISFPIASYGAIYPLRFRREPTSLGVRLADTPLTVSTGGIVAAGQFTVLQIGPSGGPLTTSNFQVKELIVLGPTYTAAQEAYWDSYFKALFYP